MKRGKKRDGEVLKLHQEGMHPVEIAKRVNVSKATIYRTLKRQGVELDPTPDKVNVDDEAVAAAYAKDGSLAAVGRQFAVSTAVVARRVRRCSGQVPQSCPRESGAKDARDPTGTERWNEHGRHMAVKCADGQWRSTARMAWEQAHGPVKKGCRLGRIDRKLPPARVDSLDNLVVIRPQTALGLRGARGLIDTDRNTPTRRDLLRSILLIAALEAGDTDLQFGTPTEPESGSSK